MSEVSGPFRWDLVTPGQLGTLLDGVPEPDLWFVDELVVCAARVLARSGDGDLYFVGRSLDSLFDLLSGALAGSDWADRLHRLPVAFLATNAALPPQQVAQARQLLAEAGVTPGRLVTGHRPVTFVDVVYRGTTYTLLYRLLRDWLDEDRAQWDVARLKIRFVGVTSRQHTSPNAFRWQEHRHWTRELPTDAVKNVSLDRAVWDYFGNEQLKLTRSFRPDRWTDDEGNGPRHDEGTRRALREAVALVERGRRQATRDTLVRLLTAEPTIDQPWLRQLAGQLRRTG